MKLWSVSAVAMILSWQARVDGRVVDRAEELSGAGEVTARHAWAAIREHTKLTAGA